MFRQLQQLTILIFGLSLFSCGYFSDQPVENADIAFVSNVLEANCNITKDAEQISKLAEENIGSSLNCLRTGLKTYTEVSKRANPNFITLSELTTFINENLNGASSSLREKLSLFFRLGNVFLNEPNESLSVKNIDAIFDLLRVLNIEAIQLKNAIDGANAKREGENFLAYSRQFSRSLIRLADFYLPIVEANLSKSSGHAIDLKEFILDIFEGNTFGDFEVDPETLDSILGFKILFVGGEKIFLNSREVKRFLEISPDLASSVFNLYFANEEDLGGQINQLVYFQKNINEISEQVFSHGDRTIITTQKDIDLIFDKYFDEMENMDFLQPTVKELKNKLIDGKNNYSEIYTFKNINSLFSLADIGLDAYLYYLNNEGFFKKEQAIRPGFTQRGRISKQDFVNSTSNLAETLRLKITDSRIFPSEVEYFDFFKFLNNEMEEINIDENVLDAAIGIKTLFVGGRKEITNKDEIIILLNKLRNLGDLYYDLTSVDLETISAKDLLKMGLEDIKVFKSIIESSDSLQPVITAKNITTIVEYISDDGTSYENYVPLIESLKSKIIKGYKDIFSVRDFIVAADLIEEFVEKLYFTEITFDLIKPDRRNNDRVVVKQSELKGASYSKIPLEKQVAYLKELNQILNTYRYYRNEDGYSFYGNSIKRYVNGLREIVAVKWVADLLLPVYGEYPSDEEIEAGKPAKWTLTKEKLDAVLFEFRPALETFGMWTENIQTFGRNILLLADLFQEQSDGTLDIDAREIAEYGGLVFMAVKVGDEMLDTMISKGYCENKNTVDDPELENDCYREHFFKTLMIDLNMKQYMTKLYDYVVSADYDEVINFVKSVEGFTRDLTDVRTGYRMARIIFGAMLNIESTLIRFDLNQDNILEFAELEKGYAVYDDAVISLSGLDKIAGGFFEYLAPKAYYYMIDKMKLPPEGAAGAAVLQTYFLPKKIQAKRLNVGKLLEGIIEQANAQLEAENEAAEQEAGEEATP